MATVIETTDHGTGVACDFCPIEIELRTDDFTVVQETIRRRGWKISKNAEGEWQHKCPACAEDEHVASQQSIHRS